MHEQCGPSVPSLWLISANAVSERCSTLLLAVKLVMRLWNKLQT